MWVFLAGTILLAFAMMVVSRGGWAPLVAEARPDPYAGTEPAAELVPRKQLSATLGEAGRDQSVEPAASSRNFPLANGWEPVVAPGRSVDASPFAGTFLSTKGSKLVDVAGQEVRLTGISWFGLETRTFAPHGLWARRWTDLLDLVVAAGANTIRLPFSNQLFDADSVPNGIDFQKNPDLAGLSGLEIMDRVIDGAGERAIGVILDRHRPDADSQSELWYTDRYPERRWIEDWQMLGARYRGNSAVLGADLHNEPHGAAEWGSGDARKDWRLAAERAGNAILSVNPDWLIVVEGVERDRDDFYWWGGNLKAARAAPVRLNVSGKLVYSPHDYGPGVFEQSWFRDRAFPANLPKIWDDHWGYLAAAGSPLLMGEFGGRSVGADREGAWQRTLLTYLRDRGLSYTYWTLNPNSGDTGGLLNDDWMTFNQAKLDLLRGYQWPSFVRPSAKK